VTGDFCKRAGCELRRTSSQEIAAPAVNLRLPFGWV